jgi:hypothetical protein
MCAGESIGSKSFDDIRVALTLNYGVLRLQLGVLTAREYVTFQVKAFQVFRLSSMIASRSLLPRNAHS